jgi:hypothetical protein
VVSNRIVIKNLTYYILISFTAIGSKKSGKSFSPLTSKAPSTAIHQNNKKTNGMFITSSFYSKLLTCDPAPSPSLSLSSYDEPLSSQKRGKQVVSRQTRSKAADIIADDTEGNKLDCTVEFNQPESRKRSRDDSASQSEVSGFNPSASTSDVPCMPIVLCF